jgi:serine/threonine protein kinase
MSAPDEGQFLPGTLVAGRYRMIGLIGRGGMGEVYRATDLMLGQSVALKFLPAGAAGNEKLLERFHTEVRIARQVSHPNVCRVYDIGEADGLPFISMEYVDGEDLASLLQRIGRLPSDKALEITRKLCAGLAAAHEKGVIHRDLKPHNVMLNRRGEVVIMDFGLAAVADELHGAEVRSGTPAYMAPEQLRGDSVTPRSDIYALGLIAYELFTGKHAFDASSVADLISKQETGRPPSITSVAADVDPAVEKVVLRCLSPDPSQRPSTPLAVAAALPGGDPLAAALAAGETPSPELVAASGATEGFRLGYAVACLAFVLAGLAALPFVMQSMSLLSVSPVEFSPSVLEQKAREISAAVGYPAKPTDSAAWMWADSEMSRWSEKNIPGKREWAKWFTSYTPIFFLYRQSPRYLLSDPDGSVSAERPPMDLPGMTMVLLDTAGRLRAFQGVAPREEAADAPTRTLDAAPVFRMAGFDLAQFKEVAPTYIPALAFDARRAWSGTYPNLPKTPVTIEMASWRGNLTSFFIRWPWSKPVTPAEEPAKLRDSIVTLVSIALLSVCLFCVIFFARRNIKAGRGDRIGAFRLAAAAFVLFSVMWIFNLHLTPRFAVFGYALEDASLGLTLSFLLWLMYMALEPAVRARWPHSLITWNRLIGGQIHDPTLGSHILLGVVVGVAMYYMFVLRLHYLVQNGGPPDDINMESLMGARHLISRLAGTAVGALQAGPLIFFTLCGLRFLLKRDWIAAVAAALILGLREGLSRTSENLALDAALIVIVYFVLAFVLLRMGMVPAILGIFVVNLCSSVPVTGDFSSWMNPVAVTILLLIASIALYGFWRSQSAPPHKPGAISVTRPA